MSRSSSVWVVMDEQAEIRAGFTVKHEMITWLGRQESVEGWICHRLPDNPSWDWQSHRRPERYPAEDFV